MGGKRICRADYFAAARRGVNLRVLPRLRALRVVVEGNRARGVEYFDGRQIERIDAKREVLLCAGAIDCPKLLMSSGVGNPVKLKSHGLQVVDSLPGVGGNLCDHPASALVLALPQIDQTPADSIHAEAGLFMKSKKLREEFDADIQFFAMPFAPFLLAAQGQSRTMAIAVQACRPKSRDRLSLRSSDPLDAPVIDPAYLPGGVRRLHKSSRTSRSASGRVRILARSPHTVLAGQSLQSSLGTGDAIACSAIDNAIAPLW